jgi:dethiobiotin synthetase
LYEDDGLLMANRYFITGIGTGVGKTIAAAIVCEALQADYWKPVQSGDLDNSDTKVVQSLISNSLTKFFPERHALSQPMSPHAAAAIDGVRISPRDFSLPETSNRLVIEGAGGLMVPLNEHYLMIDLIEDLNTSVILVSRNYLGSINHTLLSAEALLKRSIPVTGIIFNDSPNEATEKIIADYTGIPVLCRIQSEQAWTKSLIADYAAILKQEIG